MGSRPATEATPPGPTFFVLGAAKSGTTSLCRALARHPDVHFSSPKEPVFFEREYDRGLDHYRREYFAGWDGESAVGEGRVFHLFLPFVPARIHAHFPDARLVAVLRNPVDRARSHWWHRVSRGYERRSFGEAVEEELDRLRAGRRFEPALDPAAWERNFYPGTRGTHRDVRDVPYVEMGHYAEQLGRYADTFGRSRLRVLRFDDLVRDPAPRLRELWRFLGVDPAAAEPRLPEANTARETVKSRAAFALERAAWALRLHELVPKRWRTRVRRLLSREGADPSDPSPATREALARHYAPRLRALDPLVEWDATAWTEAGAAARPDAGAAGRPGDGDGGR